MRLVPFLLFLTLSAGAFGQANPAPTAPSQTQPRHQSLFDTVKPDATIVVRKHPMGPDLVEITILAPAYPPEVLKSQANLIGTALGDAPRGLVVFENSMAGPTGSMKFLKATFGVQGLIDRTKDSLGLQAIVRALATAPKEFRLKGLSVIYDGEKPTSTTLARYSEAGVALEGRIIQQPAAIEYRIRVDELDPAKITIPDHYEPNAVVKPSEPTGKGFDLTMWGLIVGAAVAAGALVYSLVLRPRPASKR
ncbi:MAG: hypothetical protein ACOYON_13445 [Fimbriimonas sp.]